MSKLVPIILEIDEDLKAGERMIDIRSVPIKEGDHSYLGYVAVIKNFDSNDFLDIRFGNLKCRRVDNIKLNDKVL